MKSRNQGKRYIKEFNEFVSFLKNVWGILAGISALFPLSNIFLQAIPLETFDEGGVLVWFPARLFTITATVASLFVILWTFSQRKSLQKSRGLKSFQIQAWTSFGFGFLALISYLASYFFLVINAFDVLGWESADSRRLIGEIPLLILYGTFFTLVTRAFVLLGMMEFFSKKG